jgi:DNA-directed RNA polymerase specialized sigma24 family protein
MNTCEHPNEETDRNRWRDLVESLRGKVPGADIRLQEAFKRGLELLLCRQAPSAELAGVVYKILANVTRTIESDGLASPDLLPDLVRRVARLFIPVSVARAEPEVKTSQPNAILGSILQGLPPNQREALKMVYVDGTDDESVCALNELSIKEVTMIRVSVRDQFLAISARERSKAMGQ